MRLTYNDGHFAGCWTETSERDSFLGVGPSPGIQEIPSEVGR